MNNTEINQKIELFPNPSGDWVRFRFYGSIPAESEYLIVNCSGEVVMKGIIRLGSDELDTSFLQKGFYSIVLKPDANTIIRKKII